MNNIEIDNFHLMIEEKGLTNLIKEKKDLKNILIYESMNNPRRLNESIKQFISKNSINKENNINENEINILEHYLLKYE